MVRSGTTNLVTRLAVVQWQLLDKVSVDLMVVLGTTTMPIHQVMRLSRGAIIELDATEADEVKILANNLPMASGVGAGRSQPDRGRSQANAAEIA